MFLGSWSNADEVFESFEGYSNMYPIDRKGVKILLAWYGQESYEGSAFVLFRKGKKLYEVNGSHCSCYGLENQWRPEETTLDDLEYRISNGQLGSSYCGGDFKTELLEVIQKLKKPKKPKAKKIKEPSSEFNRLIEH